MARRYRYAFVKKKEASRGKLSIGCAAGSLLLFVAAVVVSMILKGKYGFIVGGVCIFAGLVSCYGFLMGLSGFSEENCKHRTCIVGSIVNGIIVVGWVALYLLGVRA